MVRQKVGRKELDIWQSEDVVGQRYGYLAAEIRDDADGLRVIIQLGREEDRAQILALREQAKRARVERDKQAAKAEKKRRKR